MFMISLLIKDLGAFVYDKRIYNFYINICVLWQVREYAQLCQGRLASKVGKSLAPYLKSLVPTWLMVMNDPYTAAASAAVNTFKVYFIMLFISYTRCLM